MIPAALYGRTLRHTDTEPNSVPCELERVRFSDQQRRAATSGPQPALTSTEHKELYEQFADDIRDLE